MAITAYQVAYSQSTGNGLVTPVADRRLYEFLLTKTVGVAEGLGIEASGTGLIVQNGWGVIKGCVFSVTQETVQATTPASGSTNGRLIIHLDVTAGTIEFVTQVGASLPALTQEDINQGGSVYELALATYTISPTTISNVVTVYQNITSVEALYEGLMNTLTPMSTKLATIEQGAQVNTVTGVKGDAESSYRTGRINLTPANIGAVPSGRTVNGLALSQNITIGRDNITGIVKSNTTSSKTLTMSLSGSTLTINYQ